MAAHMRGTDPSRIRRGAEVSRRTLQLALLLELLWFTTAPAQTPSFAVDICEPDAAETELIDCDSTPVPRFDEPVPGRARMPSGAEAGPTLIVFWRAGCGRCEAAREFLDEYEAQFPSLVVEWVEVREDPKGRARFRETMASLGLPASGVPVFVIGSRSVVGFRRGVTEEALIRLVASARGSEPSSEELREIDLPLLGRFDWRSVPLPIFTVLIGLLDGFNPCAFWVLMVMLGVLLHVRSRARMALFGATFVLASGLVYFLFMTAWAGLFSALGDARWLSLTLGIVLVLMGLINLKELVWFKRGLSLTIADRAKPGLFKRMRNIASSTSVAAAFLGIAALAFVVNLVELGCTIGLPAAYTQILALRDLSWTTRHGYLALYNLAYMIPLGMVVAVCVVTLRRFSLTERAAKVLKAISGVLLLLFGVMFLLWPRALG